MIGLSDGIPFELKAVAERKKLSVHRCQDIVSNEWFVRFIWTEKDEKGDSERRWSRRFFNPEDALHFAEHLDRG